MRCRVADCPGEYELREVVRAMRQGDRIIVVEHIPAEVCDVCGDALFTPETIERLEALMSRRGTVEKALPSSDSIPGTLPVAALPHLPHKYA